MRIMLVTLLALGCSRSPPPHTDPVDSADTDVGTDTDGDTDDSGIDPPNEVVVRIGTWNLQEVGAPGSTQYEAARAVIARIDADVLGLNEIAGDQDGLWLQTLADDLGYEVVGPTSNPFGDLRNAVLTRLPLVAGAWPTSAELSGDSRADDLTRLPVVVTVDVPWIDDDATVVVQHWKSGFYDDDEFRRVVDATRSAQAAAAFDLANAPVVLMGDVNAELGDTETPARFTAIPSGMPASYHLGSDLQDVLEGPGLDNAPFQAMTEVGLRVLDARQRDGGRATRWVSGRRLDYLLASGAIADAHVQTQVYDANDEHLTETMPFAGDPLPADTTQKASDHLPVLLDLTLFP